ncbi:MAG TPA: S-adenosylmethionine:tRNA ribosyltransferase-isomerase [Acidimicrobiia bacterium]
MTALARESLAETGSAGAPPERIGLRRDGVRLMVAIGEDIIHTRFSRIGEFLDPGDVLVVNVSRTIPASLDGEASDGTPVRIHLSSPISDTLWTVEPRQPVGTGSYRWVDYDGGVVRLPGGAEAVLFTRDSRTPRLWIAELRGLGDTMAYLRAYGAPIRYAHTNRPWPLSDYQSVYAREPGSAEMPSAGRPFTTSLLTSLVANGVTIAPIVLHAGVASFEEGELPDVERYRVPETTARMINQAREAGSMVVAVGTTSVRAIETVTDTSGVVHPGSGVTDLIITAERGVRGVDGILTGWHETGASHLQMVEGVAGRDLVERAHAEASANGYLRHEFGDSLLVTRRTT